MPSRRPSLPPAPAPADVARTDQDIALLADLARTAARHHAQAGCPTPSTCPGEAVEALLELHADPATAYRLLLLAVAELGALRWGSRDWSEFDVVDPRPGRPRERTTLTNPPSTEE